MTSFSVVIRNNHQRLILANNASVATFASVDPPHVAYSTANHSDQCCSRVDPKESVCTFKNRLILPNFIKHCFVFCPHVLCTDSRDISSGLLTVQTWNMLALSVCICECLFSATVFKAHEYNRNTRYHNYRACCSVASARVRRVWIERSNICKNINSRRVCVLSMYEKKSNLYAAEPVNCLPGRYYNRFDKHLYETIRNVWNAESAYVTV